MSIFKKPFKNELIYHLLIWVLLIGPHSIFSAYLIDQHLDLLLYCILIADGLLILMIYFIRYNLIEKYFQEGKYRTFTGWILVVFVIYIAACVKMETDISAATDRENRAGFYAFYYFINISRYTVIGFLLFRLNQNVEQKKKLDQITVEKLKAEVNYLRAQINPHFLFNTLNNLYGLALAKSEKTPELIIRLSRMMDYMLYEVEGTKVLLQRDVQNLENYVEMERIRQGNNAVIHFIATGDVTNKLIEPLLFLPLVENAFKHGVNQLIDGAYLEIRLDIREDEIHFSVRNNYKPAGEKNQVHRSIGLSNLRRRLKLFYPDRHSLEIYDDNINYHVGLTIREPFHSAVPVSNESKVNHISAPV